MPPVLAIARTAPGPGNPVLNLFSTYSWTHPILREPSVHLQQLVDQAYTVQSCPGGIGSPNALGYNVPLHAGPIPADATPEQIEEHAEMAAIATAVAMHWLGRHRGSGEFAGGDRSGPLFVKSSGITKAAPAGSATPMQFHPADALSATAPAQLETLVSTNVSLTDLANVGWNRFSPYNANGVAASFDWWIPYFTKLMDLCESFTLHPESGETQLTYPEFFVDDNENWLRDRHFSLASFVHDENKANFVDFDPEHPNQLLGYTIPTPYPAGVYVYRSNIANHILQADGVSEQTRFAAEQIWSEIVGGTRVRRTFKDRWQRWIGNGVISGEIPLPATMPQQLLDELNSFGREIQFDAIRRCCLDPAEVILGYRMKASQFLEFKGAAKFDEQGLYRYSNYGWDEQQVDLRFTQPGGSSPEDFDITAGLAEAQRRIDLCDPGLPIRAWCRISAEDAGAKGYGRFAWMKALWRYCHDRGIYNIHFLLTSESDMTPLRNAWLEFRDSLPAPKPVAATAPTISGGAPVQVIPVAGGNPFANPRGDLMVRVTNTSGSSVTASAIAQTRVRPADRIYPAQTVEDMSVDVPTGEVRSIGPITTAFNDVMGNVRISCSAQANVLIEPYRIGQE